MTHRWHCRCGKLAGEVDVNTTVNRGICYCKDCQAFAYFLGAPDAFSMLEAVPTSYKRRRKRSRLRPAASISRAWASPRTG